MSAPTAAVGTFPYPHRTMDLVMRGEQARASEAAAFDVMDHEERRHVKSQASADAAFRRALEKAAFA